MNRSYEPKMARWNMIGRCFCAVLADIGRVEPLGKHAVGLQRADLPRPADRVFEVPFELGRIEGAFAGKLLPAELLRRHAGGDDRLAKLLLCLVPILIAAEAVVRAQRELDRVIEAEVLVDPVGELAEGAGFLDDLVFAAEDVGVVLRELADAHQSVQRAVRLIPVAAAVLVETDRQFLVAGDALLEDQDMAGAVHRLQRHQVGVARKDRSIVVGRRDFVRHDEHVLAILAPVAALLPLPRVHQLRGLDLLVARRVDAAAHISFELPVNREAVRVPEDAAVRFGLEVEQVHLLADLAMVALGRFLEPDEIGVELLLVEPGGAVDAAQHRVLGVAAPVGARDAGQLERLRVELAGRGEVRAAAEVDPAPRRPGRSGTW